MIQYYSTILFWYYSTLFYDITKELTHSEYHSTVLMIHSTMGLSFMFLKRFMNLKLIMILAKHSIT